MNEVSKATRKVGIHKDCFISSTLRLQSILIFSDQKKIALMKYQTTGSGLLPVSINQLLHILLYMCEIHFFMPHTLIPH